jgi:hypothetical protein
MEVELRSHKSPRPFYVIPPTEAVITETLEEPTDTAVPMRVHRVQPFFLNVLLLTKILDLPLEHVNLLLQASETALFIFSHRGEAPAAQDAR